jgi:YVTN family beta-propeller protein
VNSGDNNVYVINATTNIISDTIAVGYDPASFGNFISTYQPIGIASLNIVSESVSVYPNPATENLTIESPQEEVGSGSRQAALIEITNIQGQLIKTLATTGNKTNIDVSAFPIGVYIVEMKTENGVGVRKFVKE